MAKHVVPSVMKKLLAQSALDYGVAFVCLDLASHKGTVLAFASSFLETLTKETLRFGLPSRQSYGKGLDDCVGRIQSLMDDLHEYAMKNHIRVLFVFNQVQRFFQCQESEYTTMAELFNYVCMNHLPKRVGFFLVLTGSGMSMAWRGFHAASIELEIVNITIALDNPTRRVK
jgi:hypothetical protein